MPILGILTGATFHRVSLHCSAGTFYILTILLFREEEEDRVIGAAEDTQGVLERAGLGDDDSDDESLAEAGDDDEDLDEMASGLEAKKTAPAGLQAGQAALVFRSD